MRVAILSKADKSGGGASRIAQELCFLLQNSGNMAHHYLAFYHPPLHSFAYPLYGSFRLKKVVRRANYYIKKLGFPELVPWELPYLLRKIKNYDLLHIHDISSAISPFTVRYLARKIPTVWTFHDCSPVTGGCLHPLSCTRYKNRCGQCPELGKWPIDSRFDFTGFMQNIKRKTAQEGCFAPVVPSNWLAYVAMNSGFFSIPPKVIPHGINLNRFKPLNKRIIQEKLQLPLDRPIVLLVAAYLHDELKGLNYALEALSKLDRSRFFLLVVGNVNNQLKQKFSQFDCFLAGYIADDDTKANYFAAADLLLLPSLGETFSLVTLETMATATPTVGFAVGGIKDLVQHNHTGYLVPPKDVAGLVTGINLALSNNRAAGWGRNARQRAEQFYSHDIFLKRHLDFYEQVIRNFKSR